MTAAGLRAADFLHPTNIKILQKTKSPEEEEEEGKFNFLQEKYFFFTSAEKPGGK